MVLRRNEKTTYEALRDEFRWRLPAKYNLGVDVADRQNRDAPAIITTDGRRITGRVTFGQLAEDSNRLANALAAGGIRRGDRVGIILSQRPETAVAHIAVYKLGAIAVPLSILFGADALDSRLRDSGAIAVIGETEPLERVTALGLAIHAIDVDRDWESLLAMASPRFEPVPTEPDTPALIIYTSGTTGPPKGALHGHRILYGHLPGVELSHNFFPHADDVFWTPADWAWIGGLFDVLMPALHHGRPVVAFRAGRFDPEQAFDVIANLGVRNLFLPPTALRMMRQTTQRRVTLRSVGSGGETLGADLLDWGRETLGVTINEFYGQTEANLLISNCSSLFPVRPGWMGRAVPGHDVRLIEGQVAVRVEGDPVVFLRYWNNPDATAEKVPIDGEYPGWLRTGDMAEIDGDGWFRFIGRVDDIISSGGYRIGPGEVESCLASHPAVALAAVIGAPDAVRGEIVKAFVVPAAGREPTPALAAALQTFVKNQLAAYEYPRQIEFVESLPMTTTGKIRRGALRAREAETSQ
jgi:acetyl-CoA synthetase